MEISYCQFGSLSAAHVVAQTFCSEGEVRIVKVGSRGRSGCGEGERRGPTPEPRRIGRRLEDEGGSSKAPPTPASLSALLSGRLRRLWGGVTLALRPGPLDTHPRPHFPASNLGADPEFWGPRVRLRNVLRSTGRSDGRGRWAGHQSQVYVSF